MKPLCRKIEKLAITLMVLLALSITVYSAEQPRSARFASPSGRVIVQFTEIEHIKIPVITDAFDVSRIKYHVSFFDPAGRKITGVEFIDVYGSNMDRKPRALSDLFKNITWSPAEDFALLPEEGWASAPSSPYLTAVNLDEQNNWSMAKFNMEPGYWADKFTLIGFAHGDCDYRVEMFDGKTGQSTKLRNSASPVGYQIASADRNGVIVEKVLDNCATDEDKGMFVPQCERLDFKSMVFTAIDCPQRPKRKGH